MRNESFVLAKFFRCSWQSWWQLDPLLSPQIPYHHLPNHLPHPDFYEYIVISFSKSIKVFLRRRILQIFRSFWKNFLDSLKFRKIFLELSEVSPKFSWIFRISRKISSNFRKKNCGFFAFFRTKNYYRLFFKLFKNFPKFS